MRNAARAIMVVLACGASGLGLRGLDAQTQSSAPRPGEGQKVGAVFQTGVPPHAGSVILGRPTDRSVTLSILTNSTIRARVDYGPAAEPARQRTDAFDLKSGEPRDMVLDGLARDTAYGYRVLDADTGAPLLPAGGDGAFHTCRPPGSTFTFAIQADSHLDEFTDLDLYHAGLTNVLAGKPDFLIDLGDTFMTGKHPNRESAARQYAAQRYWLGLAGQSAPVFLALGNHDGEEAFRPGAAAENGLAVWACRLRKSLFPNPEPSAFYSGNTAPHPFAGALQDYYAWEWGDALFVVLDPYWSSGWTRGGREPWNMSLGKAQYDWLVRVLRASTAKFKFVFIHQLVGGLDAGARGGAEAAKLYEWGGLNTQGHDEFAARRPGWEGPVHRVLVESGVQIVFHGHDHFFARQALDGVVYQLVPQPAHRDSRKHQAAEYGYQQGDFMPNSGHLRVTVSPVQAAVEYIRTPTARAPRQDVRSGKAAFRYEIGPEAPKP